AGRNVLSWRVGDTAATRLCRLQAGTGLALRTPVEAQDGRPVVLQGTPTRNRGICLSPEPDDTYTLYVWELPPRSQVARFPIRCGRGPKVAVNADGSRLAVLSEYVRPQVWNLDKGAEILRLGMTADYLWGAGATVDGSKPDAAELSPDGGYLAVQ